MIEDKLLSAFLQKSPVLLELFFFTLLGYPFVEVRIELETSGSLVFIELIDIPVDPAVYVSDLLDEVAFLL